MRQGRLFTTITCVFLLLGWAGMLQAQTRVIRGNSAKPVVRPELMKPVPKQHLSTGLEAIHPQASVPPSKSMLRSYTEEVAGQTQYDLQSNGCESARVHAWDNGEVAVAWAYSNMEDGTNWPDRGTGYNRRSDWMNNTVPSAKLEAGTLRTGFPNYVVTEDGTEFIVAHRAAVSGYRLHTLRRAAGASAWTESDIPTTVPKGQLWSKAVADGNTIHVIALTPPTGTSTGGDIYKGMNGHVLYYRSKDAGLTWDITDGIIPGLDSTAYDELDADKYCIDARNGVVAVGIFDSWNDSKVWKSNDGGDTWNDPYVVWDFPLDKYHTDSGYTVDDIGGADPNAPDSLAIFTVDGSASIVVDAIGYAHVFVGEMYVLDKDLTDGNTSYYPGTNGMIYWNESAPADLSLVTYSRDWDGNDTLDITGTIIGYNVGLSSMAAAASDENANLYLAYSSNVERLNDDLDQNYRHIYTMKSVDYGATWSDPVDVHYKAAEVTGDSLTADFTEGVWPSADKWVQDKFHVVYQRDFSPGSAVQQANVQNGFSDMIYIANSDIVGTKTPAAPKLELSVYPNPAANAAQVGFELTKRGETTVEILDVTGAVVSRLAQGDLAAGQHVANLYTAKLPNGLYFVRVQSGNQTGVKKLVVLRTGK